MLRRPPAGDHPKGFAVVTVLKAFHELELLVLLDERQQQVYRCRFSVLEEPNLSSWTEVFVSDAVEGPMEVPRGVRVPQGHRVEAFGPGERGCVKTRRVETMTSNCDVGSKYFRPSDRCTSTETLPMREGSFFSKVRFTEFTLKMLMSAKDMWSIIPLSFSRDSMVNPTMPTPQHTSST